MHQQCLYEYRCLCVYIYEHIFSVGPSCWQILIDSTLVYLNGMDDLWSVALHGRSNDIVRR